MRTLWRMMVIAPPAAGMERVPARPTAIAPTAWRHPGGPCGSAPLLALATLVYLTAARPSALLVGLAALGALGDVARASPGGSAGPCAAARPRLTAEQTHLPAQARPQDLGLLRDLRRPGRQLAAARQLSGASGRAHRPPHLAHQHRALPAGQPGGLRFRLHHGRPVAERTANTFRTMEALERYRGHFFNWYDTQSLKPLQPLYISTVDSGNLAGHLLTLRPGCSRCPISQS